MSENRQFIELIAENYANTHRPYYSIKYRDLNTMQVHIGYGSYKLDVISEYIREYFIEHPNDNDDEQNLAYADMPTLQSVT